VSTQDLVVSEIFGPTFQGEGPSVGQLAAFLRLAGCNLDCRWCDTPYTWDASRFELSNESRRMTAVAILRRLGEIGAPLVVVTGGEPLLHQERLPPLLRACHETGRAIEVETNGTLPPSPALTRWVTRFNVSPKLANSGVPAAKRIRGEVLAGFRATGRAIFKFVVECPADLEEVSALERDHRLAPIWIMPCGQTAEEIATVMRQVAEPVLRNGWNLTPRLHVLLWGNERGR
jgi:7-cyano-7-deazaguanosine (preQ0) biosynthesis protein QueE